MNVFDEAWQSIIRPVQIKTKISSYGPKKRIINNITVVRQDINFFNRNGKKISGFIFSSPDYSTDQTIFYLHGNGGSKYQVLALIPYISQFKVNLVAFDFLGCGNSDSDNLTYGINQVFDIRDMLEQTRKYIKIGRVTLWGRSMGSLCAIMFADMYSYQVSALILDSPFKQLARVIQRVAKRKVNLPDLIIKPLLYFIKKRAVQQIQIDIFQTNYLEIFKKLNNNMPILFIYSNFDSIVPGEEVLQFYNSYKGPKDLYQIYRTHDQDRPQDLFKQALMWIMNKKKKNFQSMLQARQALMIQKNSKRQNLIENPYCNFK